MITLRRISLFLIGMLTLLVTACTGLGGEPRIVATVAPSTGSDSQSDIAAVMTQGGELWANFCAECHGDLGEGTDDGAPLPDLTALTEDDILSAVTNGVMRDGIRVMPSFADDMSPDQLMAAATFARMVSTARANGMIQSSGTTDQAAPDVTAAPAATVDPNATEEPQILGVVTGTVSNGTAGATLPAELTLTLHVLLSSTDEQTFNAAMDTSGAFRFENVPFDAAYQYAVTAEYGPLQFVSEVVPGDPSAPELNLPVEIFEITSDPAVLRITTLSSQVMVQDGTLQVIEIVGATNSSDRAFIDVATSQSVRVHIPDGATFEAPMSSRYGVTGDNAVTYDTRPVMPGVEHLMHVSYSASYSSGMTLTQSFEYPIDASIEVVLANQGISASGDGLTTQEQVPTSTGTLVGFTGTLAREANVPFSFTLSGTPADSTTTQTTSTGAATASPIAYVLIGAGITALLLAVVLTIRDRIAESGKKPKAENPKAAINSLMEQIAELDMQHKAGKISARDYEAKRTELKTQLSQLMNSQK